MITPYTIIGAIIALLFWLGRKKSADTKQVHGDVSIGDDFTVKAADPKVQAGNDYYTTEPQPTGTDTP